MVCPEATGGANWAEAGKEQANYSLSDSAFSHVDGLCLFIFEIVLSMWVKTEVSVRHRSLPSPCDFHWLLCRSLPW